MKYEIITDISGDGLIIQKLLQDKANELISWVCDTREVAISNALIKLGWTPPNTALHADSEGQCVCPAGVGICGFGDPDTNKCNYRRR